MVRMKEVRVSEKWNMCPFPAYRERTEELITREIGSQRRKISGRLSQDNDSGLAWD